MTAPAPLDLAAVLDDLERPHAAGDEPPWHVDPQDDQRIADANGGGVAATFLPDDAEAIVAAVNAVPTLIAELRKRDAALRAVEALADEWQRGATRWEHPLPVPPQVAQVRSTLAAALSPESVTS